MADPMEKRNVVHSERTPEHELTRSDENWDKKAADLFENIDQEMDDLKNIKVLDTAQGDDS